MITPPSPAGVLPAGVDRVVEKLNGEKQLEVTRMLAELPIPCSTRGHVAIQNEFYFLTAVRKCVGRDLSTADVRSKTLQEQGRNDEYSKSF